jgi:hypothetical protein
MNKTFLSPPERSVYGSEEVSWLTSREALLPSFTPSHQHAADSGLS